MTAVVDRAATAREEAVEAARVSAAAAAASTDGRMEPASSAVFGCTLDDASVVVGAILDDASSLQVAVATAVAAMLWHGGGLSPC